MELDTGSLDHKIALSLEGPLEGIDLSTAARQVSLAQPERGRLSFGDVMDIDLCSAPLLDASGLSDMLSGDLSSLVS